MEIEKSVKSNTEQGRKLIIKILYRLGNKMYRQQDEKTALKKFTLYWKNILINRNRKGEEIIVNLAIQIMRKIELTATNTISFANKAIWYNLIVKKIETRQRSLMKIKI